jgi:drug/metabolite transporter (DMT)-like permease
MIAVLGGLGAALAWTVATVCSSRSSRAIGPAPVVAWVMLVGLIITLPLALASGIPNGLDGDPGLWLAVSAGGNVAGLLLVYAAMRVGQVALVAPLVSTEGAIAAVIAIAAGESVAPAAAAAIIMIAMGVALSSMPAENIPPVTGANHVRAPVLALAGAMFFGVSLYATARAGGALPWPWVVLSARLVGAFAVALPLASRGRLLLKRRVVPLVLASGLCEVLGFYAYISGARHGIAIAAVLASQFASFAVLAGYVLFRERLARTQLTGVAIVMIGVTLLSALQG